MRTWPIANYSNIRIVSSKLCVACAGLPLGVGAALGAGVARQIRILSSIPADPAHYREYAALGRLAMLEPVRLWNWIIAAAAGCVLLWLGLALIYQWQGRRMGWRATLCLCLPVAAGVALLCANPLTDAGRSMAVAAIGFAGPGQIIAAFLLMLSPLWIRGGWRPNRWCVWLCSVSLTVTSGVWMVLVQEPTGDEPSYLLAMHSLVYDHDLDVGNNHARQDYRHFYPTTIHQGQLLPTRRGITLPKHSLGLPVLGAAVYGMGGRLGVSLLCSLITAALAASVYHVVLRRGRDRALRCWSVVLLCAPLALYAGQIYPNAATGLLAILVVLCAARHPFAAGVAAGVIPWFHLGTWPLAVAAAAASVRSRRGVLTCLAGALPFWAALAAMHFYFWGRLLPPMGAYGHFSAATLPVSLVGLFLDQEAGLLWVAPVWLFMLTGIAARPRVVFRAEGVLWLGWVLYVSTFNWWYGGWSPTGRFLLPVVGMMALLLGEGLEQAASWGHRLWLASGAATMVLVSFPFFRFNARDGSHAVLDALASPGRVLASLLPSLVAFRPSVWAAWAGLLAALLLLQWHRGRQAV